MSIIVNTDVGVNQPVKQSVYLCGR